MKDKIILGIDPGTEKSAYVFLCGTIILSSGYTQNDMMIYIVMDSNYDMLAVEGVRSFGPNKKIGNTTLITCELSGILYQTARSRGKFADILYSNTTSRNGNKSIRGYYANRKRDDITKMIKKEYSADLGDYKNQGTLYMPSSDGKTDHKICALTTALVFKGSQQYKKECKL